MIDFNPEERANILQKTLDRLRARSRQNERYSRVNRPVDYYDIRRTIRDLSDEIKELRDNGNNTAVEKRVK